MLTELPVPSTFGRYELRSVLGRGGMGVVYEAVLVGLVGFRKRVALKVLPIDAREDAHSRSALQREARIGAMLSHPNIVAILDLGREQGQWFLAMELVDGRPVSALRKTGVLSPADIVEIGLATCAGLAHIHDLRVEGTPGGLVHRDIKPQNLLVDRHGTLKIADFGIASLSAAGEDRGGSPAWMAPEQGIGPVNARADLFSLGAVLYTLAAGRTPFGAGTLALREATRVEELLRAPSFLEPVERAVPGLAPIVSRCLRRDPADRYPSAAALAADLRALRSVVGIADLAGCVERARAAGDTGAPPTPRPTVSTSIAPRPGEAVRPLVGRSQEVAVVVAELSGPERRVTVTGTGGVGKTRLAREVAAHSGTRVVWVDGRAAGDLAALVRRIGRALGIELVHADPLEQVVAAVAARPGQLLVLDGVEAVAEPAAAVVEALAGLPAVQVLVTSRVPLRAVGEQVVPLGPLTVDEGCALFRSLAPTPLTEADEASLPALVEGLDGLPLAIELAAARVRTLAVPQILERLRDRFRLLVDPSRPGWGLRSTLAESFELLKPWEARALGELAVFAGGFTLEAAEAVVKLDEWPDAPWVLDVVSALLDASLLRHDRVVGRFSLGHSVRTFALEQLPTAVRQGTEVRHGEYFAQLGAEGIDAATASFRAQFQQRVEAELENLCAAVERAAARGDARVAETTAYAAAHVYHDHGPYAAGVDLIERVTALPGLARRDRLEFLRHMLCRALGRRAEALQALDRAQAEAERTGDTALALSTRLFRFVLEPDARVAADGVRAVAAEAHAAGMAEIELRAWSILGNRLLDQGDVNGSRQALVRALDGFGRLGDGHGVALATLRLGRCDQHDGRLEEASRRFEDAEKAFQLVRFESNLQAARDNRAVVLSELGALEEAQEVWEQVLTYARRTGDRRAEGGVSANLAELALRRGRPDEARARLEQALVVIRGIGWTTREAGTLGVLGQLEAHLGHRAAAQRAWREGAERLRADGAERQAQELDTLRALDDVAHGAPARDARRSLERLLPAHAFWHAVELGHLLLDRDDAAGAKDAAGFARRCADARPIGPAAASALQVLDARLTARDGDPVAAAHALSGRDRVLRDEGCRVRLWQARAETLRALGDRARAGRSLVALRKAVDRAAYGADTPIRRVLAALAATIDDGSPVDESGAGG